MREPKKALIFVMCMAALSHLKADSPYLITENGAPKAVIILDKNPARTAQLGAFELQYFIKRISGAELPITTDEPKNGAIKICVGENPAIAKMGVDLSALKPQEYVINFRPGAIILAGKDPDDRGKVTYDMERPARISGLPDIWGSNGTLYAVYDFLERFCGVRWFNPTEFGTGFPERKTLEINPVSVRRSPAFVYRDAVAPAGIRNNLSRYDEYTALWPKDSKELDEWDRKAYPALHSLYPDKKQYAAAKSSLVSLFLLRNRCGGELNRCNHSLYGYYDRFWEKNPSRPELFERRRPEFFAKGYDSDAKPPQLCYTNPELIKQIAQDARDYYDGKKTGDDLGINWRPSPPNPFPIEPMDSGGYCKCADCQKLLETDSAQHGLYAGWTSSNYIFNLVNEVSKELRKTHPDKSVIALAYSSHSRVPSLSLDPGVAVHYCFASNRNPWDTLQYQNDMKNLEGWAGESKKSGRPLFMWLYYAFPKLPADNSKHNCFPGFFAHVIDKQMKLFHSWGVKGFFFMGFGQELEAYVTFKLMDDPSLDTDKILGEYFTMMYGAAGEPMRKMHRGMESAYCDPALRPDKTKKISGPEMSWGYVGDEERMKRFGELLEEAKKLADTEKAKARLELFEKGVWEYMTAGAKKYLDRKKAPLFDAKAAEVPDADGNPAAIAWEKAAPLPGAWFKVGGDTPSAQKLSGKTAYDSKYLYLELTHICDTSKLITAPRVFPCDVWEIYMAAQRGLPFRQCAVSPSGEIAALSQGEVNWRMDVPMSEHGIKAVTDRSAPDRWTVRLAFPLDSMLNVKVKKGDRIYMNILRMSSGKLLGINEKLGMDSWVSFSAAREVDRLAEITLD